MTITDDTQPLTISEFPTKRQLWFAAIKPPMYTVAIIPISFGTALAYKETGIFDLKIFITFLLSAISIIAWLNLSNDVFDADTGIDVNKAHSVVNLTGNKSLVFWISVVFLLLGLGGIFFINYWLKDWTVLWLIIASCALGYSYQGPPFRFGYLGLGEIICFFTFGPMAIASAYYSQTQNFSVSSVWASSIIGISTSIILFCSHFHQVKDDIAAGKKSPIVRLGTDLGSKVLTISVILFYGFCVVLTVIKILPYSALIVMLSLPIAYQLTNHVNKYHNQPDKVKNSKFIAVNLHFLSGVLLCLGLI
ncbi:2-carboxy-1,4-naphthoquinone phytyltransferase [Geminocystis sp. NIES-3709]|uniref:2-carboxy-1,4-naphthoquinone phytyltransferase n=1 Tax=Geminocystis sp. NIES-3709 TaxID=1617448 RepID=UPI0005FCA679|nr:2-carboxy-1,4-naphthoquinone phytyltransferase [Geminocystis sp. NIES-3709]BAQ64374.1 1,4-dihydroxy-2-naphthoate polyprenyltransferase [Geminocystis sp. NIES-3709]